MSGLREIATFSLDSLAPLELYGLVLDGERVLAGTCDLRTERPGVVWCDLSSATVHAQFLPDSLDLTPSLDGYSWPFAMRGQSIAVMVGENRGIERSALCVLDHDGVWQISRRTEVLGYSAGASHFVHLSEEGSQAELVVIPLGSGPSQRLPFLGSQPRAIALSPALTHLAVADSGGVVCLRMDGSTQCSWPAAGSIHRLWFAEDDLAVIALKSESVGLHQWGGGVQEFSVPSMSAKSFEPSVRTAFFWNRAASKYVELDLSSGSERSSGFLPELHLLDVDLRRRRIATYKHGRLRVFQMP